MTHFVDFIEPQSLTKADLAKALHAQLGGAHREAKDIVDSFFEIITDCLARGEVVRIAGFGNFNLHRQYSRPGRNPRTGAPAIIPARTMVRFVAMPTLKALMQPTPNGGCNTCEASNCPPGTCQQGDFIEDGGGGVRSV